MLRLWRSAVGFESGSPLALDFAALKLASLVSSLV